MKDPLGLSYYRRLSITEQLARGSAGLLTNNDQFEKSEVWLRRYGKASVIPFHPLDDLRTAQYQLPNSELIRYVLPSYASHVILQHV